MTVKQWTEAEDDQLRELCKQGLYFSRIAKIIGRSKNSCLGRAARQGYTALSPRKPVWNAGLSKDLAAGKLKVEEKAKKAERVEALFCETVADDYDAFKSVPFEALEHGMCRWPRGEARDMVFCGCRTLPGSSWCVHHKGLAFVPYKPAKALWRGAR